MKLKLLYTIFPLSALLLFGVIGGMDKLQIKLLPGTIISLALSALFCWTGLEIERTERREYD